MTALMQVRGKLINGKPSAFPNFPRLHSFLREILYDIEGWVIINTHIFLVINAPEPWLLQASNASLFKDFPFDSLKRMFTAFHATSWQMPIGTVSVVYKKNFLFIRRDNDSACPNDLSSHKIQEEIITPKKKADTVGHHSSE
jgi:hypothetical protein